MRMLACEAVSRSGSAGWDEGDGSPLIRDLGGASAEVVLVQVLDDLIRTKGRPDALAVAAGPGSFTGLRVAVMAIRTLAWIEKLPVHAVDSLVARACEAGPGLWWVLVPLKKDTTFHALVRVHGDGRPEVLAPSTACHDAEVPVVPAAIADAIAIGPALTAKPDLLARWRPGQATASSAGLTALGVLRAARHVDPVDWSRVLPAYLQEPAPVLQRRG